MAKPRLRNNVGRFQKYASAYITKHLENIAEATETDITKIVEDKLLETYKTNVVLSYGPRSQTGREVKEYNEDPYRAHKKKLTYRHTHIFENSIDVTVENKTVKIIIRDEIYPDGASTVDVYKWLTNGTMGGGSYPYIKHSGNDKTDPDSYSTGWSYNFPTPAHLFEEFTRLQMKGFLDSLENDIHHGKYYSKRYFRKKG